MHRRDVTKYLTENRTDIEIRGRNDKPLGGWDQRKTEDEIKAGIQCRTLHGHHSL